MNEQHEFLKLLKYSNELEEKNESLRHKDYESFKLLLNFFATIENNFHYLEKQEYIQLTKNFLADKINADDFSYSFIAIYEGINQKLSQLKTTESVELTNFLEPARPELGKLLASIYGYCDSFSQDIEISLSDEQELKNCAQLLLVKLQL